MSLLQSLRTKAKDRQLKKLSEARIELTKPEVREAILSLQQDGFSNATIASVLNDEFKSSFTPYKTQTPKSFFEGKTMPVDAVVKGDKVEYTTISKFTSQMIKKALAQ